MNPTIEKLILQITWLCLQITSQGKWHAFASLSGHVRNFHVHILAADTDYEGEHLHALYHDIKYQLSHPDWHEPAAEIEHKAIIDLQQLLAELEQYLDLQQLGRDTLAQAEARPEVLQ